MSPSSDEAGGSSLVFRERGFHGTDLLASSRSFSEDLRPAGRIRARGGVLRASLLTVLKKRERERERERVV